MIETEKLKDLKTERRKSDIFRFREFPVYKDARKIRNELKQMTKQQFPKEEQYVLTAQLCRALDSVLLNIAEGADRYSDMDFSRFLNNALTSVNEAVGCLDCALDDGYLTAGKHTEYLNRLDNLARQLRAFSAKVRKDS